jgi:hypothetical protein
MDIHSRNSHDSNSAAAVNEFDGEEIKTETLNNYRKAFIEEEYINHSKST